MVNKTDYVKLFELSSTQQEVVNLLCAGNSQQEIAGIRGCSVNTVMQHSKRAREKLGYRSIFEMVTAILQQRVGELERSEAATQKLYQAWHDRALKAEQFAAQLNHALRAVREDLEISAEYGEIRDISSETIERIQALRSEPGKEAECPRCNEALDDDCEPGGCRDPFCPMMERRYG